MNAKTSPTMYENKLTYYAHLIIKKKILSSLYFKKS